MNGKEFAEALLVELDKKKKRRVKVPATWDTLEELIRDALDPQPFFEEDLTPVTPMPVMLPDWPKLKERFDYAKGEGAQEWIIVANAKEEAPYHGGGWYTTWPPNMLRQIQGLGQGESLQSHVEKLKAKGVKERPAEDWERRKQKGAA